MQRTNKREKATHRAVRSAMRRAFTFLEEYRNAWVTVKSDEVHLGRAPCARNVFFMHSARSVCMWNAAGTGNPIWP